MQQRPSERIASEPASCRLDAYKYMYDTSRWYYCEFRLAWPLASSQSD